MRQYTQNNTICLLQSEKIRGRNYTKCVLFKTPFYLPFSPHIAFLPQPPSRPAALLNTASPTQLYTTAYSLSHCKYWTSKWTSHTS